MGFAGTSKFLYPLGSRGKNWWMVWAFSPLMYAPPMVLYSTRIALMKRMAMGKSDWCFSFDRKTRNAKPRGHQIDSSGRKSVAYSQYNSLRRVTYWYWVWWKYSGQPLGPTFQYFRSRNCLLGSGGLPSILSLLRRMSLFVMALNVSISNKARM